MGSSSRDFTEVIEVVVRVRLVANGDATQTEIKALEREAVRGFQQDSGGAGQLGRSKRIIGYSIQALKAGRRILSRRVRR